MDMDGLKISVRGCRREDAPEVARLLMMAWPVEDFLAMDKSMTMESLHDIVTGYVSSENNLYSYSNTLVAVAVAADGEKIAGAMNCYDGAFYESLKRPVMEDLQRRTGSNGFGQQKETEAGEFYLDSVAVDPDFRSHGIGSSLFHAAIRRAAEEGHSKVGLIVDVDKPKAEALYLRLGFRTVGYRDFFGHEMKHMQLDL